MSLNLKAISPTILSHFFILICLLFHVFMIFNIKSNAYANLTTH